MAPYKIYGAGTRAMKVGLGQGKHKAWAGVLAGSMQDLRVPQDDCTHTTAVVRHQWAVLTPAGGAGG